ncbi:unnamed protein product [Protopolystoma xenopodis]|uniref:Uncharacterized protein n=1 Tax=Protopolystoma xenopodis TaxID=117903 RepID=A0A3S5AUM1_9PLAT|nr:unnamed protein product [Protopolystoma xenopodis]
MHCGSYLLRGCLRCHYLGDVGSDVSQSDRTPGPGHVLPNIAPALAYIRILTEFENVKLV